MMIETECLEWVDGIMVKSVPRSRAYLGKWCVGRVQGVDDCEFVMVCYLPGKGRGEIECNSESAAKDALQQTVNEWMKGLNERT